MYNSRVFIPAPPDSDKIYTYEYDNEDGHLRRFTGTERQFQTHLRRTGPALILRRKNSVSTTSPVSQKPVQLILL